MSEEPKPAPTLNDYLTFARQLAFDAGEIMRNSFGFQTAAEWKEDNTPLTAADTDINRMVVDRVQNEFPEHGVLGEERSYEPDRSNVWIVNPISGTQPYSVGAPLACFSLAFAQAGEVKLAIICEPIVGHTILAVKGQGAFHNDTPIKLEATEQPIKYIAMAGQKVAGIKSNGQLVDQFDIDGIKWFNFRSYMYPVMLLALGKIQSVIFVTPKVWDVAAAKLIVKEAGGRVTDLFGQDRAYNDTGRGFLLSNGVVHDEMLSKLQL